MISGLNAPVAGADYTATDDAAGVGMDVTDDITIQFLAELESGVAGRGHVVRISNAGSNAAYLQSLVLYADHCWRTRSSSAARAQSAASPLCLETGSGRLVNCRYIDHHAAAKGAAEARLAEYATPRSHLEATLPLAGGQNHRAVIEAILSDVVVIPAATHGITGAWFLEGMEIAVGGGGVGEARWWLTAV